MKPLNNTPYVSEPKTSSYLTTLDEMQSMSWYRPTRKRNDSITDYKNGQTTEVIFRQLVPYIPSTTYGTFGLYRYPAKFIPHVVAYIIENYGEFGESVIDPFAGSGTTGLVARLFGLNYELWDLNPLLGILHEISIMRPPSIRVDLVVNEIKSFSGTWLPDWSNLEYWFPDAFIPFLGKIWGYYHNPEIDPDIKKVITVPFLKLTRILSYNDAQRQKLSRSPLAIRRVNALLNDNWQLWALNYLETEMKNVLVKLSEYHSLMMDRGIPQYRIYSGVDSLQLVKERTTGRKNEWDILVTSPPYLQAQEYIRASKIDLFWLGFSEKVIRDLSKKELPYNDIPRIPIHSETYKIIHNSIQEPHLLRLYERYFHGVLGVLTLLAESIKERMFLFVGPASIRANAVPIDRIIIEHFTSIGWIHEATLIDTILARVMFRSTTNPATGLEDKRMKTEHLVILKRKK